MICQQLRTPHPAPVGAGRPGSRQSRSIDSITQGSTVHSLSKRASPETAADVLPRPVVHRHAIEMAYEGIPLPIIQRQLGHAHLGITSIYLQGIDTREIVDTVHHRRPPVIPASAGLRP